MSWQKCPICNGTGEVLKDGDKFKTKCRTCNGKGIIHSETGKYPMSDIEDKSEDMDINKVNDIDLIK